MSHVWVQLKLLVPWLWSQAHLPTLTRFRGQQSPTSLTHIPIPQSHVPESLSFLSCVCMCVHASVFREAKGQYLVITPQVLFTLGVFHPHQLHLPQPWRCYCFESGSPM